MGDHVFVSSDSVLVLSVLKNVYGAILVYGDLSMGEMTIGRIAIKNKIGALKQHIADLQSVAVAFSSGVDSTFLLNEEKEFCRSERIHQTNV